MAERERPPPLGVTRWTQFRGDARNAGLRPDIAGPNRPAEDWTADLAAPVTAAPVLDRAAVYVGCERGALYAFDRERGHRRWVDEGAAPVVSTAAAADRVHVARADGAVSTLGAVDGDPLWDCTVAGPLAADLSLADGTLYVGADDGLAALDAATGEVRWRHETDGPVAGAPAVADGRVYVATREGTVRALAVETGEAAWTAPTDGTAVGGPTAVDGRAYVADDEGTLLALDGETGRSWFAYEADAAFTAPPAVVDDTTFVPADDGHLHVTDTTFGRRKLRGLLFTRKGLELDGLPRGSPIVAGDVCCVADSRGGLYGVAVDDPDFVWHAPLDAPVAATPALADGQLYVARMDERLSRLAWEREPSP